MEIVSVLFLLNIGLSLVAGWVAKGKGRSSFGYFAFSFFFTFLLAILILIALPPLKTGSSAQLRECPFCKEQIQRQAIVCKHCGRDVEALPLDLPLAAQQAQAIADYKGNKWLTLGGIATLLGIFSLWIWFRGINDPSIPTYSRVITVIIELAIFGLGVFWVIKGNIQVGRDNPTESRKKSK